MLKLIPTVLMLLIMFLGYLMMGSGSLTPFGMVGLIGGLLLCMAMLKPKKASAAQSNPQLVTDALGDFAKDAFTDDSQESITFRTAVSNMLNNQPKGCLVKLQKLESQCRNDAERYAVAIVSGMAYMRQNMPERAIPQYNQAIILHPTSHLAMQIGACHQRMFQLPKARDSYEFALELEPNNLEALSALATTWVADEDYEAALEYAGQVLEMDESHASALATTAICYGLMGNKELSDLYADKAQRNGYNRKKIEDTIKTLKK